MNTTIELESPRKRFYHRVTGTIVMLLGSSFAVVAFGFLTTH